MMHTPKLYGFRNSSRYEAMPSRAFLTPFNKSFAVILIFCGTVHIACLLTMCKVNV